MNVGKVTELNYEKCACKLRKEVPDPPMHPVPGPELDPIPHPHRTNPQTDPKTEPKSDPKPEPEPYDIPPFIPGKPVRLPALKDILKRLPKLRPGPLMIPPIFMPKQPKPQEA